MAAVLAPAPAYAHKLKLWASAQSGARIEGYAYFPGGGRAPGAKVEVFDPAGRRLAECPTDNQGAFAYDAPYRCDLEFRADSGDGHAASMTVTAAELPETLPPFPGADAQAPPPSSGDTSNGRKFTRRGGPAVAPGNGDLPVAARSPAGQDALARQIAQLREQLNAYEDKVRLRDVLGGIGYIAGLAGVVLYFKGRARRNP
jgi:nickel transport protein